MYGLSFPHPYHLDAKKLSAFLLQSKSRIRRPWFILLFCLAAVAGTYLPYHYYDVNGKVVASGTFTAF